MLKRALQSVARKSRRAIPASCFLFAAIHPLPFGAFGESACGDSGLLTIDNGNCADSAVFTIDNGSCAESDLFVIDNCDNSADFNGDGQIDLEDLVAFMECGSGPAVALRSGCEGKDLDRDGDVDQSDFGIFQQFFRQSPPAGSGCAP